MTLKQVSAETYWEVVEKNVHRFCSRTLYENLTMFYDASGRVIATIDHPQTFAYDHLGNPILSSESCRKYWIDQDLWENMHDG